MQIVALAIVMALGFAAPGLATEVHVIDGDTLWIDGIHYRLHGIDAPEAGQRCSDNKGGTWHCGDKATRHLEGLVGTAVPDCDDRGTDDYDRVISVCTVDGRDINRMMVLDGYAWAFRRYSEDYVADENIASERGINIWQAATQTAWEYRAARWQIAAQEAPDGCPIKGNISSSGRIYHAPWSPWYTKTRVSTEKGERWFCTEREALDAGWRAPVWGR